MHCGRPTFNLTIGSWLPCIRRVMDARDVVEYERNKKQLPNIISSNSVSPSPLKAYMMKLALKTSMASLRHQHASRRFQVVCALWLRCIVVALFFNMAAKATKIDLFFNKYSWNWEDSKEHWWRRQIACLKLRNFAGYVKCVWRVAFALTSYQRCNMWAT